MISKQPADFQFKEISSLLTKEELSRIEEAFNLFITKSGTDTVKPKDIVNAMKKSKYDLLKPSIFELFESINTPEHNESGITFKYFIEYLIQRYNSSDRDSIKKKFELFDVEGKGYIEFDRLTQIANELGDGLLKDEALLMFERGSSDKEKITFDDFYYTMTYGIGGKGKSKEANASGLNNTTSYTNIIP